MMRVPSVRGTEMMRAYMVAVLVASSSLCSGCGSGGGDDVEVGSALDTISVVEDETP